MLGDSIRFLLTQLWNNMLDLRKINNELKSFINQANFISQKTRNKLIRLLASEFEVDLPLENFANIDVQLTEEGHIIMRGDLYKTKKILSKEEVERNYAIFKEKAESLINKKEVNYHNKKDLNNILNIIIVALLAIIYLIAGLLFIKSVLSLQLFNASILVGLLSSYLVPSIKARFEQAKNFLKRKFKRKK